MKTSLLCFALILLLAQTVSAEIAPIIWSESIRNTPKPTKELINLDNHMILKSDRSLSINLSDHSPIKSIDLRLDDNDYLHLNKKDFLFNIQFSDKIARVIDIPFGEHKFN
ncbi:hypothetical protein [Sporomusa sp.]|uniref:hypothetical protein n=1 Tax=Sporomusa sp. TaxID=2078658 RepID=UPI002BE15C76|nr:hypothetical protein [Sporomusa sp.]HWR43550.1 hypothetical protein [Sporomusa sp.]